MGGRAILIVVVLVAAVWTYAPTAQVTRYVYLSPVDGAGTEADPYHSRCLRMPGMGNIDLRQIGINRFLCASDTLPANMTGIVQLGSNLDAVLSGATKTALENLYGKAITASDVRGVAVELLRPILRAGRDGKLKLWLGEATPIYQQTAWMPFPDHGYAADIWNTLQPAVAWATTLTEPFTAANGDLAGCACAYTWTEFFGPAFTISGNAVAVSGTTTNEARADSDLATDNMEVQATVTGVAAAEQRIGVIGRKDSTATRTYISGYAVFDSGAADEWRLLKRVASASTTLNTNATDPVNGDVVESDSTDRVLLSRNISLL